MADFSKPEMGERVEQTVTCKIALVVTVDGDWGAVGWPESDESTLRDMMSEASDIANPAYGEREYWVTITVPVPGPVEVAGEVEAEEADNG